MKATTEKVDSSTPIASTHDADDTRRSIVEGDFLPPSTPDPAAERRLRKKIDLHLIPIVSLLYLLCFIDRANLGTFPPLTCSVVKIG